MQYVLEIISYDLSLPCIDHQDSSWSQTALVKSVLYRPEDLCLADQNHCLYLLRPGTQSDAYMQLRYALTISCQRFSSRYFHVYMHRDQGHFRDHGARLQTISPWKACMEVCCS